jgi:energy-coupling factor transporter transmembrane protein EcfT
VTRGATSSPLVSPACHLLLLAAGLVVIAALPTGRPFGPLLMLALCLAAAVAWRVPAETLLRRALPLASCGLIALTLLLVAPVEPTAPTVLLPHWSRPVSAQATGFLLALWVKTGLIVLWLTAAGQALSERDLLEGLLALHLPARVTNVTYLVVRGLHTVRGEVRQLARARDARGRPRGRYALQVAAAMSQMLLVRLGRRAETQGLALAARGFTGRLALLQVRPLRAAHAVGLFALMGMLLWLTRISR